MKPQPQSPPCTLTPINLHNPPEYAELQSQRRSCGWDYADAVLLGWRAKQEAGLKSFFWITVPGTSTSTSSASTSTSDQATESTSPIYAGHISLDSYADPPDAELANADRTVLTIQTFFVQPEYRAFGVGRAAMDQLEALATQAPFGSPACQHLAITCMTKAYYVDGSAGIRGTGIWTALGRTKPDMRAVEWYERRGYVKWKSEERWPERTVDGEQIRLIADFMKKPVAERV